ncbi:MAG: hypothetical protein JNM68_09875 [Dinghuibacter sp.]|nr:hypothetical protein [Dinghuibacter sp.]
MNRALLFIVLLLTSFVTFAQPGKRIKRPAVAEQNNRWRDDSLLWVKKNPPVVQTANTQNQRTRKVNNTKLDDLKNPFDTGKVVQPRQAGFSRRANQPGANLQSQRALQPSQPNKRFLDSTLPVRNPVVNNTHTQTQRVRQPAKPKSLYTDSIRSGGGLVEKKPIRNRN